MRPALVRLVRVRDSMRTHTACRIPRTERFAGAARSDDRTQARISTCAPLCLLRPSSKAHLASCTAQF
ncbi:hypothetical protein CesoFtcFv8_002725 [Champsocephalus esox]|uniref:Uncharacterized protein n=1 Tax=Champsocephalus esox TaxID=159716 RepID=A0AAN8CYF5_9TELE|nr:hypothetical protein CesoFtcFv8_002725 [Champsocephalus esox]